MITGSTTPGTLEEPIAVESLEEKMARLTSGPPEGDEPQKPDADTPEGAETPPEGTEEQPPEGGETPPEEEEPGQEKDEEEIPDEEKAKLSEHVQKRIGKLTAKRKEAEERAATVETELETVKARNDELEAQLSESFAENAFSVGIAPQFLTKDELAVLKHDQELDEQERFFFERSVAREPYEDPKSGDEYTPEQMARFYHEVKSERQKIATKVYAIKTQRTKEMMDALEAGRKAMKNGGQPSPKPTAPPPKAKVTPPKVPNPSAAAPSKPPISQAGKAGFDGKKLAESGNTRAGLIAAFENSAVGGD